ncbi:MAG: hypothetical protein E5X53_12480 [Mesorhizobium sp.]|nr:MAG: hypothetical protein E5X55_07850 [Mesorhizobium sp.]TIQ14638.1 MAG: hypothetical protein E5X57_04065 [Mesorhizobium sp.]TIR52179.1 MAG: hypothetical protein E5X53_12480 [Mesorhizobium sp.]TJV96265.1 MAG: hypothetical protein E5X52_19640 [Mesorhizobium sp.]
MMDSMELHGRAMADARERITQTELALERTEEMLAENIALCSRIRRVVEAVSIPPAMKVPPGAHDAPPTSRTLPISSNSR